MTDQSINTTQNMYSNFLTAIQNLHANSYSLLSLCLLFASAIISLFLIVYLYYAQKSKKYKYIQKDLKTELMSFLCLSLVFVGIFVFQYANFTINSKKPSIEQKSEFLRTCLITKEFLKSYDISGLKNEQLIYFYKTHRLYEKYCVADKN